MILLMVEINKDLRQLYIPLFDLYVSYKSTENISKNWILYKCFRIKYYSTDICRDLRDCPAGREFRFVPTLFVSRGTRTGTKVRGASGTGTNFRGTGTKYCGTVPSRPLPIPGENTFSSQTRFKFEISKK